MALRHRSATGAPIAEHRAFATLPLRATDIVTAALLALGLTALWFSSVRAVCGAWAAMFDYWQHAMGLNTPVITKQYALLPGLSVAVPYLSLPTVSPFPGIWWVTATVTALLVVVSFRLPKHALPSIYLLRLLALIQSSSLIYFAVAPASFPHGVSDYMADMLMASLGLISLVPVLLGFTFYIFDFGLPRKLLLTLAIVLHLCAVVPLQYLVQACVLHWYSLLFMPLFYLFLGLPLNVMMIIAFYGWGMSWEERRPVERVSSDHRRTFSAEGSFGLAQRIRAALNTLARRTGRLHPDRSSQ